MTRAAILLHLLSVLQGLLPFILLPRTAIQMWLHFYYCTVHMQIERTSTELHQRCLLSRMVGWNVSKS